MAVNIVPTAMEDGIIYADAVPITSSEADLNGGTNAAVTTPVATTYGSAILAIVQLSVTGIITANSTYVVMQMDLGDGVWIDLNWLFWDGRQGSATFVFSNGIAGANSFRQSRSSGSVPNPQANGANQMVLGGRIRFVGKTTMAGGSSSVSGTPTVVSATITYKLLGLR